MGFPGRVSGSGKRIKIKPQTFFHDKVAPLHCLAAKKHQAANNGENHVFYYCILIHPVAGLYSEYHCNAGEDEDKRHDTHKYKRHIAIYKPWYAIKNLFRRYPRGCPVWQRSCGPEVSVGYQQ